jgi:hypothetical protein
MKVNLTDEQLDAHLLRDVRYQCLTPKQREFVKRFIQNKGDLTTAGMSPELAAHYKKNPTIIEVLRSFGYINLKRPRVGKKELARLISNRLRDDRISTADFIELARMHEALKPTKKKPATIDEAVLAAEKQKS